MLRDQSTKPHAFARRGMSLSGLYVSLDETRLLCAAGANSSSIQTNGTERLSYYGSWRGF